MEEDFALSRMNMSDYLSNLRHLAEKQRDQFEDAVTAWMLWDEMRYRGVSNTMQNTARREAIRKSLSAWGYEEAENETN